jgi:hypothetical protein
MTLYYYYTCILAGNIRNYQKFARVEPGVEWSNCMVTRYKFYVVARV